MNLDDASSDDFGDNGVDWFLDDASSDDFGDNGVDWFLADEKSTLGDDTDVVFILEDYDVSVPYKKIKVRQLKKLVRNGSVESSYYRCRIVVAGATFHGYLANDEFHLRIDGKVKSDDDEYDPFTMFEIEVVMGDELTVPGLQLPFVTTGKEIKYAIEEGEQRSWAEIPNDVLSVIFQKLGAAEVLLSAQGVCRTWRQVALDPSGVVWRCIDMRYVQDTLRPVHRLKLAQLAIDRSGGQVEELYIVSLTKEFLTYIVDQTTKLRCLALVWGQDPLEGVGKLLAHCPLLEELNILSSDHYYYHFSQYELKSSSWKSYCDGIALEIARNMQQLRRLQIIRFGITNKGLDAIVDKCLHLQSLDIRCCSELHVDKVLQAKLAKIKTVKLSKRSLVST